MNERTCGLPANFLVNWPGTEPRPMCDKHAEKARHVGSVLGCHVSTTPADAGMCSQIVAETGDEK